MRRVFFAITLLFALYNTAQAQKKKDRIITVTVSDSTNLLSKVVIALFDNGYYPDYKDDQAGLILTKEKDFNTHGVRIKVKISDTTITLTGEAKFWSLMKGRKDDNYEPVYYSGMKGSDLRNAWDEIDKIAHLLGTKITYSK